MATKTKYIETFPTIDLCVDYLVNIGCKWSADKETELTTKKAFKFKGVLVIYDPYNLLAV